jgi:hypothetical protein
MNRSAVIELPVAESHAGRVELALAPAYPLLEDFQFAGVLAEGGANAIGPR